MNGFRERFSVLVKNLVGKLSNQMAVTTAKSNQKSSLFRLYHLLVSCVGVVLALVGMVSIVNFEQRTIFFLLVILAITSSSLTASLAFSDSSGITYHIGSAVALVAIPFYGPLACGSTLALSVTAMWWMKPTNRTTWKKTWEQLVFNIGMSSIAGVVSGLVFLYMVQILATENIVLYVLTWFVTAIAFEVTNHWLLITIIRLQHGRKFSVWAAWMQDMAGALLGIIINFLGAIILVYAVSQFDWVGIAIFFLPILLSAFAFRLYVNNMQSHLENLDALIEERTRELALVNAEKDAFLAVLTHDMKAPLTSVNLYAEMLRRNPELATRKPHIIDNILRAQGTLLSLVNNILDLERLQNDGTMVLDRETFNLVDLITYVVETMEPQAKATGIELVNHPMPQNLLLKADRLLLERALTNLVSNAIKYTADGGCVQVRITTTEAALRVSVEDNGYGIPEDELPFIFDRFHRVTIHQRKAVGTGLGLAITKAIVEAHGGGIEVKSKEGVGSIFTIQIPLSQ